MKKKNVSKAQRERHHSRWYWLWWFRSAICIVLAMTIYCWNQEFQPLALVCLSGAAICWIYAWVHSQLEITCDKDEADCKDDHTLGVKKSKTKAVKKG